MDSGIVIAFCRVIWSACAARLLRMTNSANESLRARGRDWTAAANLPAAQEETTALGKT